MKWRALRVVTATHANRVESEEIVRRLMNKDIPLRYVFDSLTTRGTHCVRVYVQEEQYDSAWEALDGMALTKPQ